MNNSSTLRDLIALFIGIISPLITLLIGLSLLVFFWGLVRFIYKAGDEKSHEEGKKLMTWGLIALFIMVSIYGILRFFYNDIFSGNLAVPFLPTR